MKICFLGDALSIHIQRWCEYFRDQGHDVYIITFRKSDIKGVKVKFVGDDINVDSGGGNAQYLKKIFKIKKLIREINPDIVNAHYLTSYGLIGALTKNVPLVVSTWGSDILVTPKRNKVYRYLTQFVIRKSDLLTSDSKFMSEEIINLGGKREKVITAPMGVNKDFFDEFKDRSFDEKTFLSMRTLCENSNIECILKAFKLVLAEEPDSKLIVTNSGEDLELVKNQIKSLDIEKSVEYLGFVNREKVCELLSTSQVYLSVPTSDSTSVNLLEGMAKGIFPIVSDLPANNEWIEDAVNGFVLKDINENELSKLMLEAVRNNSLREKSIQKNRDIIKSRAVWEENMAQVTEAYKILLGSRDA